MSHETAPGPDWWLPARVMGRRKRLMRDLEGFSRHVLKKPLYGYQLAPARAVLESIQLRRGDEFLLIMARQSGKNELVAQLLVFLLNNLQRRENHIVYAAIGDNLGRGIRRLEAHLDNGWNKQKWEREGRPARRSLGKAAVVFISSHPQAHARGESAHQLLVIDELQDQDAAHVQAVFQPMRAARNATAVYLGTVRTTYDALWLKKEELERLQARDGVQRVFMVGPEAVCAENEHYERFLAGQIAKHGREHPLIASEYFLEPMDRDGGLFPERRVRLMRGGHNRQDAPLPGDVCFATLDVAGIDEGTTDPVAALDNPARDYTTCTIFRISDVGVGDSDCDSDRDRAGPVYEAVDVFVDQGSQHFREHKDGARGSGPSLARQLLAYLEHWQVAHVVGDATGVGEGLLNWLAAELGPDVVTAFKFTRRSKAQLGVDFLALVETNRFKYWQEEVEFDDAWWFFQQMRHCAYELEAGRPMETHLRWFVPGTATISTPTGMQALHDDRLVSAALIAEADKLLREKKFVVGRAESVVVRGYDPIEDLTGW